MRPDPDTDPVPAPVGPEWRYWIAENRLLGCAVESLVAAMVDAGVDPAQAVRAVADVSADPVLRAGRALQSRLAKLESVLASHQGLWEAAPGYAQIERCAELDADTFFRNHYLACRPVVIGEFCRRWPAMQRWQPALLAERFADREVEIQSGRSSDPDYELNSIRLRKRVRFGEFMARVMRGEASNDEYLTANNRAFASPDFASLRDDVGALPTCIDRSRFEQSAHWWVGPRGTKTPLHHDTVMLFHAQVVGRKRWRLISPLQTPRVYNHRAVFSRVDLDHVDFDRFPLMRGVQVLETVVEPGEALFLPLAWWHQVDALDISVSASFSALRFPNTFDYADPGFG